MICPDRYGSVSAEEEEESEELCSGQNSDAALESSALQIFSSGQRCQSPTALCMSEAQDQPDCGFSRDEAVSEPVCTERRGSRPGREPDEERCFSPGETTELQVSLSEQTSGHLGSASLLGILGEPSGRDAAETVRQSATGVLRLEPGALRKPATEPGLVLGPPAVLGLGEGVLEHPARSEGRSVSRVGGPEVSGNAGPQSEGEEEGGGGSEGDPGSFSVSCGIPSDEVTPAQEQDSDSEGEQDKPHKHHARHASKCSLRSPEGRGGASASDSLMKKYSG